MFWDIVERAAWFQVQHWRMLPFLWTAEIALSVTREPGKSAELSQLSQLSQLSRKPKEEEGENSTYFYGKHRGEGNFKSPRVATVATVATVAASSPLASGG
jgi:hypothetical protein